MTLIDTAESVVTPPLHPGEIVEVLSREEILATLDESGELESMPFMPEMLEFAGRRFAVAKRAHKICDTVSGSGLRRLEQTVLLDGNRCEGSAHGGCDARCPLLWKEAWLKRVDEGARRAQGTVSNGREPHGHCTEEMLHAATTRVVQDDNDQVDAETLYSCQATELLRATGELIRPWNLGQYVEDVQSGNVRLREFFRGFIRSMLFPPRLGHPLLRGKRPSQTPTRTLDLQPGERVRVRSRKEILETLDTKHHNRGLNFDTHLLRYCGREARVLGRVRKFIDEHTGKMIQLKTDCIVLEGVICHGDYRRFCPRGIYPWWREIWLERVEDAPADNESHARADSRP
jgi:hypothetical protein